MSHIPADHRRTETGCGETHSAVGLVRLFPPEKTRLPMNYTFPHSGGVSGFLDVKARIRIGSSNMWKERKEDLKRDQCMTQGLHG